MAANKLIGIAMSILVFTILIYTCYQLLFNVLGLEFSTEHGWTTMRGSITRAATILFLCIASLVSYSAIMLKPSNPIPLNTNKDQKDLDVAYNFPELYFVPAEIDPAVIALSLSTEKGHPLFCQKCVSNKPERAHHCKVCQRCTPKMDHHCVWVNGCVDEENYKQFFLFVLYVAFYCIFAECTVLPPLLKVMKEKIIGGITLEFCWEVYKIYISSIYHFWRNVSLIVWNISWSPLLSGVEGLGLDVSVHWYVLVVLGFVFGMTLTGFMSVHFWYIIRNQTSVEYIANRPIYIRVDFDKSGKNYEVVKMDKAKEMYNVGWFQNWRSVMGSNPLLWFVPLTKYHGDSHKKVYPYNLQFCKNVVTLAKTQRENRLNLVDKGA